MNDRTVAPALAPPRALVAGLRVVAIVMLAGDTFFQFVLRRGTYRSQCTLMPANASTAARRSGRSRRRGGRSVRGRATPIAWGWMRCTRRLQRPQPSDSRRRGLRRSLVARALDLCLDKETAADRIAVCSVKDLRRPQTGRGIRRQVPPSTPRASAEPAARA